MNKFLIGLFSMTLLLSSCEDDITVTKTNESAFQVDNDAVAYLASATGMRGTSLVEFRDQGFAELYLKTTKDVSSDVSVSLTYNEALLTKYNEENNSDYKLFPKELIDLGEPFKLTNGTNTSSKIGIKVKTSDKLASDQTYVIPVETSLASGNVALSETESKHLIFVKDLTKIPSADKASGIKIISCMEVNDTNPLNNLCFTLKGSGKPLFDMVILFSGNINYNNETGEVYVYNNPNVQHILDNREKYLKPLQDRGIKIILGILGNHDRAGISGLSDETARVFAQDVKAVCDAYHLDGIFVDDEYSRYIVPPLPGFIDPGPAGAARLCYEVKKAMPDRLVCAYAIGSTSFLPDVDGVQPGKFVDYGIHDYGIGTDLSESYPGMPRSRMGVYSQEFARYNFTTEEKLEKMRNEGYGAHMIFSMNPLHPYNFHLQKQSMEMVANKLFDDELVYDEKPYEKDW